jgi:hypothetical protein
VARDRAVRVVGKKHRRGAIGATVVAEVIGALRVQHDGVLAAVGVAQRHAHGNTVTGALRRRVARALVIAETVDRQDRCARKPSPHQVAKRLHTATRSKSNAGASAARMRAPIAARNLLSTSHGGQPCETFVSSTSP